MQKLHLGVNRALDGCAQDVDFAVSFSIKFLFKMNDTSQKGREWYHSVWYARERLSRTGSGFLLHLAMRYRLFTALY